METISPDLIRDELRRVAMQHVFGSDPTTTTTRSWVQQHVTTTLQLVLEKMILSGKMAEYHVSVEVDEAPRLGERDLPVGARPGDMFRRTGIVVSSDGKGKGIVFDPHPHPVTPGEIHVHLTYRPFMPVEYVSIEFDVGDSSY